MHLNILILCAVETRFVHRHESMMCSLVAEIQSLLFFSYFQRSQPLPVCPDDFSRHLWIERNRCACERWTIQDEIADVASKPKRIEVTLIGKHDDGHSIRKKTSKKGGEARYSSPMTEHVMSTIVPQDPAKTIVFFASIHQLYRCIHAFQRSLCNKVSASSAARRFCSDFACALR